MSDDDNKVRLHSYLWVRRAVGIIGMALPFLLIAGDLLSTGLFAVRASISDYYYTIMGNLFVGALCAISLFLLTYKGYNGPITLKFTDNRRFRFLSDNALTDIAAVAALGVAFFPCHGNDRNPMLKVLIYPGAIPIIHYLSAAIFFIALASMSIWSFTRSDQAGKVRKHTKKYARNMVYRFCGFTIFLSIALIGILGIIKGQKSDKPAKTAQAGHKTSNNVCDSIPVTNGDSCQRYSCYYKNLQNTLSNMPDEKEDCYTFILETVSLLAFGFSWFIKGETLLKD